MRHLIAFLLLVVSAPAATARKLVPVPDSDRPLPAASALILPYGTTWKYLDNGSNQGTAWRAPTFNDATWKSGPAQLGYGDGDEATVVSYGPYSNRKYITTYFRKAFAIADVGTYSAFSGNVKRDDGVVVYVNGVEVFRNNMPTGSISYTTLASKAASDNGNTPQNFTIKTSAFINGTNIIAVEVHQSSRTSSDISFDLEISGTLAVVDSTPPSVMSIMRKAPTTQSTSAPSVTFGITFSEKVRGVNAADFSASVLSGTLSAQVDTVTVAASDSTAYDVTISSITGSGELRLDLAPSGTGIRDMAGNAINSGYTGGQHYTLDRVTPSLTLVSIASSNSTAGLATAGDSVTLDFTASEAINTPLVTLATHAVTPDSGDSNSFTATYIMTGSDAAGPVPFTINFSDTLGNAGAPVTTTTDGSSVTFEQPPPVDSIAPRVESLLRHDPADETTTASSLTYKATFTEAVTGVDETDFTLTVVSGDITGTVSSVTEPSTQGDTYNIIISNIAGEGTLRLDLEDTDHGIEDIAGNALAGGYTSGETYSVTHPPADTTAPAVVSIVRQNPIQEVTSASSVTFRVLFSEKVTGVETGDFTAFSVSGQLTAVVASAVAAGTDSTTFEITVGSVTGSGILRLDLKPFDTGITDTAGNTLTGGFTTGESYTVQPILFTHQIVSYGANWKYLDNGSDQGTAWRSLSFNDSSWKSGPAQLGYGDGDEATVVSYGPNASSKYITTYFRKSLTLTDVSAYSSVTAKIKRDDGTVVYVNGMEVYRNNMPSGNISFTTLASTAASDNGNTPQSFNINPTVFVNGTNIIAVEVHQSSRTSSDISFDLEITAMISGPDQISPAIFSILRQSPSGLSTSATQVTFRTTFTEKVRGVDSTDFNAIAVRGTLSATVSEAVPTGSDSTTYDVMVRSITGSGELRLDLKSNGTAIEDEAGNPILEGYSSGQSYIIQSSTVIQPVFVSQPVLYDADDPAIWINKTNPSESLIIGTDKGDAGALYAFDMQGKIIPSKVVNLQHPNNVDVAYGLTLNGSKTDIVVATERNTGKIRVFSLPDMRAIDNGGINVFTGETGTGYREPMGIALYTQLPDSTIYAIVSRKAGPTDGTYLWQYRLEDDSSGNVRGTLVRKFGNFSRSGEIEAVAVDNELGYVYYSEEYKGVRKYHADPTKGNTELALFATQGFTSDREGISLYKIEGGTGYILVSDQQANGFHIFSREGSAGNPHDHQLLKVIKVAAQQSDGSELVNIPIVPNFTKGLFVAMSNNKTFHLYRWEDIAGSDLQIRPPETLEPGLTRGPYLQMVNQSAATLRWRTAIATDSRVEAGTAYGNFTLAATDSALTTEHEVRITGLSADTKYFYRVGSSSQVLPQGPDHFFMTAPAPTSKRKIRVAAFGDCGLAAPLQQRVLNAYLNHISGTPAELLLLLGDNAYTNGTDIEYQNQFFVPYSATILKNHALFPTPGNHDYLATTRTARNTPYYLNFSLPAAGECGGVPSGSEAYYSFDWGNIHFISLDSYGQAPSDSTHLYDTLGPQVSWVKQDLEANNSQWTVVFWHHPPFTKGSHNSDTEGELILIRQNFIRILERYGVDLVLCGHSHNYERSYLQKGYFGEESSFDSSRHTVSTSSGFYNGTPNSCPYTTGGPVGHGTVYVVSGSSAKADTSVSTGFPHNALPFATTAGGMFLFDVEDNRLDAKFIREDGTIYDQFTIMKEVNKTTTLSAVGGEPLTLTASWIGRYSWSNGDTTRSITVTPTKDVSYSVTDNGNCLFDKITINIPVTLANPQAGIDLTENNMVDRDVQIFPTLVQKGKPLTLRTRSLEVTEALVTDVAGRQHRSLRFTGTTSLETSQLPAGNYFLILRTKNKVRKFRFLVAD